MVHSKQENEKAKATTEFAEYRDIIYNLLQQTPNNPLLKYMYADALAESAMHAIEMGDIKTARLWLQEAKIFLDELSPNEKSNQLWASRLKTIEDMLNKLPPEEQQ